MRKLTGALFLTSLVIGLVGCTDDASEGPVDPPDQLGEFGVGHMAFTAVDETRGDRSLVVDIWYPVDPADMEDVEDAQRTVYELIPYTGLESLAAYEDVPPSTRQNQTLLVFSHGYGGINIQSTELMEALASHGFIVASPEHTGNAQGSNTDTFDEAAGNRVPDVSFLIDTMVERNRDSEDPFYGRLNEDRFGVIGHSFGGMTAIGMAAGWADAGPDPRVAAIVPISAVIDGDLQSDTRTGPNAGFTAEQLSGIDVPVMLIGGTEDDNVPVENNSIAFEQMNSAPTVYQVDVIGANHTHFANVCDIGNLLIELGVDIEDWPSWGAADLVEPYQSTCTNDAFPIEEATRLQNLYVVSFFKRHLLNQVGYDQYLTEEHAEGEPEIEFSVRP